MKLYEIDHEVFEATVSLQGAQLIHFKPKNELKFLWSSDVSTFISGQAFRAGIPICWTWFGKSKKPSHGFACLI